MISADAPARLCSVTIIITIKIIIIIKNIKRILPRESYIILPRSQQRISEAMAFLADTEQNSWRPRLAPKRVCVVQRTPKMLNSHLFIEMTGMQCDCLRFCGNGHLNGEPLTTDTFVSISRGKSNLIFFATVKVLIRLIIHLTDLFRSNLIYFHNGGDDDRKKEVIIRIILIFSFVFNWWLSVTVCRRSNVRQIF